MSNFRISSKLILLTTGLVIVFALAAVFLIEAATETIYSERKDALKTQVDIAYSIVTTLHSDETAGKISREEAIAQATALVSQIHYEPNGVIFGYDYSGVRVINPGNAGVGKNFMALTDKNGTPLIKNIIDAGRAGGGFSEYLWPKPGAGDDATSVKVSYSKAFDPWQLVLGTGAYLDDIDEKINQVYVQALGIVAAVLVISLIGALAVVRGITRPLTRIHSSLSAVSNDDVSIAIPHTNLTNEIGMMARATKILQDKVRDRLTMEQREADQQRLIEQERSEASRIQEEEAAGQAHVVKQLSQALAALSEGDLTVRCSDLGSRYDVLRANFNSAISRLLQAMQAVARNAGAITAGSEQIRSASDELSKRTEQQAASVEETAAALEEITTTVAQASRRAEEAGRLVRRTRENAEVSGTVVGRAIEAMSKIEASSAEISGIIGVIDEIAFQTNLLALNAGVEAARAGDAGKGFAVVAQEVRELAQRSAKAAQQINQLIAVSNVHVQTGVALVGETGSALSTIVSQVKQVSDNVEGIVEAAKEQSLGIAEINQAINVVDRGTQQNAAMVEESAAAAHSLAAEAAALLRLLAQFNVGGGATSHVTPKMAVAG
ncbi:HAMP domain-containing protein [Rhizobium leguminosarum bv. viciae]|uniref:Probable MCP type chemoreceptor n=2 Tax=Rhizobium TaxID=379 RepID=Q1M9H7_RHIJ3|nr:MULTISPECIES: methyl-accepting chemotaxis protein [Rhizobium]MBX5160786.1 HAMP domain-containing protein [Rhizobium sp. NZLR8]MBY5344928.1 HAMP domain-containing protein [Rhizobium leguminosarum]MBY5481244.1 HAMP domain-containing protein [Rhizobium leguminosarum]MBY5847898.1 HAMP domain-containing protein [Rhizobium leguminosarum]TAT71111.1 HAMP domain-containing protein [Rhizobium ruizarguesonis]